MFKQKRPKRRWSDNDSHFGPFTFSRSNYARWFGIVVDSGGGEDRSTGCHMRIYFGKSTLIIELPNFIPVFMIKHQAQTWDAATIARIGRDYYFETFPREYGFTFDGEGSMHTYFGPQTHDSETTKNKVFFLPWRNWRFVAHRWYGLKGELLRTGGRRGEWDADYKFEDTCPKVTFEFDDYDGKRIKAKTFIEEREWHFGTGWFTWLSCFVRPRIRRSLSINFSEEVGPEKGSWKGGTIGHGIEMLPTELHEAAFRRYCEKEQRAKSRKYHIKYVGRVDDALEKE